MNEYDATTTWISSSSSPVLLRHRGLLATMWKGVGSWRRWKGGKKKSSWCLLECWWSEFCKRHVSDLFDVVLRGLLATCNLFLIDCTCFVNWPLSHHTYTKISGTTWQRNVPKMQSRNQTLLWKKQSWWSHVQISNLEHKGSISGYPGWHILEKSARLFTSLYERGGWARYCFKTSCRYL
jgi:hypothetical protein